MAMNKRLTAKQCHEISWLLLIASIVVFGIGAHGWVIVPLLLVQLAWGIYLTALIIWQWWIQKRRKEDGYVGSHSRGVE